MNVVLKKVLDGPTRKKANPLILDGLSRKYTEILPDYLSSVIESAVATLPTNVNFRYRGWRMLTPLEDFYHNINSSISKNTVDLSRNSLFKIELGFEYEGMEIKRILSLPYVDKGGFLKLSDANYALVPVLSEYPVAPAPNELFIRLLRDKLSVKKMRRNILINKVKVPVDVFFSKTYKLISKVNHVIPIALYTLVKYGFTGTFKTLLNTEPLVFFKDEDITKYLDEYDVYETLGVKPRVMHVTNYVPHSIRILIKKTDITPAIKSYVGSLIYSFDMSPEFAMELRKVIGKKKEPTTDLTLTNIDEESLYWLTLLGKIIFKNKYTLDRVQVDMLEHINILNNYLDTIIKDKLKETGIELDDFYSLLHWSILNFDVYVRNYESHSSNLSNRYIDMPYYILYKHIEGINKAFLEIKRSTAKKVLTEKDLHKIFNDFISTKKIFGLIQMTGLNLALIPIDVTGDQFYWKVTSILPDQSQGQGVIRSKREAFPLSIRKLKAEDLLLGSISHLPKKTPSPRLRMNVTLQVDIHTGKVIFTDEERRTLTKVDALLNMKREADENIKELLTQMDSKDV